jgi:hypothetical protein
MNTATPAVDWSTHRVSGSREVLGRIVADQLVQVRSSDRTALLASTNSASPRSNLRTKDPNLRRGEGTNLPEGSTYRKQPGKR